jgi:hypothetical protein
MKRVWRNYSIDNKKSEEKNWLMRDGGTWKEYTNVGMSLRVLN